MMVVVERKTCRLDAPAGRLANGRPLSVKREVAEVRRPIEGRLVVILRQVNSARHCFSELVTLAAPACCACQRVREHSARLDCRCGQK